MDSDISSFLAGLDPLRRSEAAELIDLFQAASGFAPRLWPGKIVGFGRYDYRYDSGHSGSSLATGFSPRKADLSLYVLQTTAQTPLLDRLGKHRTGKICLYLKRLADADRAVLHEIIVLGLADLRSRWTITAG